MKAARTVLVCLLLGAVLGGCASGKKARRAECEYAYEKDGIVVHLGAAEDANQYNNQAHTTMVVWYQLANPSIFKQMLESSDGVARLLEGKSFDASVLARRQLVVQPGENRELRFDRVRGGRYLGVVAGFYDQQSQNYSRLYPVPTQTVKSLFGKEKGCYAEALEVELRLGADGFIGAP